MNWKTLFRTKTIDQITREMDDHNREGRTLKKTLGTWDLTAFGVAAVLGAGVFSTIGNAASGGGPAVVFLFLFTAVACAFSAFCYAEFASSIPVAGSAYTYAYASFGELIAWIIGWDLLMEYAIGNIAVAISWSQYFTGLLAGYGIRMPKYCTMDYLSASRAYHQVTDLLAQGKSLAVLASGEITPTLLKGYDAWMEAPRILGIPFICDLPALLITVIITWVVFLGIEESKKTSNILVIVKILVVLMVIFVGATYVNPANWVPFAPHGASGVLKGVSAVFFAYIGFDAISTTAEECKDPQRDLPRGMIYSLIICTTLYALVALVLTGMVSYKKLGVGDPLAFVFGPEGANLPWISGIIDISAVIALATVLLVFQVGQPRIWMAMSRDGLLPPVFASIHPKYKTPWVSTLLTGAMVAIPSLFMNLTEVTDLTSIGTLFAFILVCGGILRMDPKRKNPNQKFKTPYINSKYIFPALVLISGLSYAYYNPEGFQLFFNSLDPSKPEASGWEVFQHKIPFCVFSVAMVILSYFCFVRNLSLIPVLGLATCGYLMTELGITNWIRFGVWLILGIFVYCLYGIKHSRLRKHLENEGPPKKTGSAHSSTFSTKRVGTELP
jgi:amino acid transporter